MTIAHVFERPDRGATATEYALLFSIVVLVIVVGLNFFGGSRNDPVTRIAHGVAAVW